MTDNNCQEAAFQPSRKDSLNDIFEKKNSINQHSQRLKKFAFNISMDNLKPFLGKNQKTEKKLAKYNEDEQSSNKKGKRLLDQSQTVSKRAVQRKTYHSPDLPRDASNSILQKIESIGLSYEWCQGEECREGEGDQNIDEFSHIEWSNRALPEEFIESNKEVSSAYRFNEPKITSLASTSEIQPQNYLQYEYMNYAYSYFQRPVQNQQEYYTINPQLLNLDPRTTLMIKNIPNKYTIKFLSEEIDKKHKNTYDFLYLPFDMKSNCNVGYGFINFISTEELKKFYETFQGKKWKKFYSEKICHLTYARLQGLNALIEHFQNSKVLTSKEKQYQPIIREFSKIETLLNEQRLKTKNHF